MRIRKITVSALALLVLLSIVAAGVSQAASYQVVVHEDNPANELSRAELSRLFLKKTSRWSDGTACQPVDRERDAAVRDAFSRDVHDKEVPWIESYWQRLIFSGRETPPPQLTSDREVLEFVSRNRGAVGYVSSGTSLDSGVKELRVSR